MFAQKKPYSAVSVQIDRMTSEQYEEDDLSGIIDLIEVVRIQSSGPTEAARAIRKKLKYGNVHRQIRALTILDGLIQNAGSRFQRAFADEPLLERLRILARDDMVDPEVRKKCNVLFRQWAIEYKNTQGLSQIAALAQQLPKQRRQKPPQQYKSIRETEENLTDHNLTDHEDTPHRFGHSRSTSAASASGTATPPPRPAVALSPTTRLTPSKSSKDKKSKNVVRFSVEKERPNIMQTMASASVASTNLINGLQLINRETQRVSDNPEILNRFETCKLLRRQILRYIQLVETDELIGSLLSSNDELVKALTAYEIMDRSIEDDSDSDAWEKHDNDHVAHGKKPVSTSTEQQLAGLNLDDPPAPAKPPRPQHVPMPAPPRIEEPEDLDEEEEDDDDDPFGDSHAAKTPVVERPGMTWKTV